MRNYVELREENMQPEFDNTPEANRLRVKKMNEEDQQKQKPNNED